MSLIDRSRERETHSLSASLLQKVYDFHKKTVEVYPERLRELNRQFLASISNQITTEPYSVLVGNCLDYVRKYFNYEEDLLQYSPWLATRLKQARSDIVHCLQDTIDLYDALARQDFDRLFEKKTSEKASTISAPKPAPTVTTTAPFQFTLPSASSTSTTAPTTTQAPFQFTLSSTSSASTSTITTPSVDFNFKIPTTSSATATTNASPFAFSIPNTGIGTVRR